MVVLREIEKIGTTFGILFAAFSVVFQSTIVN